MWMKFGWNWVQNWARNLRWTKVGALSKYDIYMIGNEVKIHTCQSNINLNTVPMEAAGPFCIQVILQYLWKVDFATGRDPYEWF